MLLLLSVLTAQAQVDFKLYFANNVGEVSRVSRLKDANSELIWKEVTDGTIMTNLAHMEPVKKMFGETRQKTQADQELFWKMRDDNLLCFRINDGKGTYGEFEASSSIRARTRFPPFVPISRPNCSLMLRHWQYLFPMTNLLPSKQWIMENGQWMIRGTTCRGTK